MLSENIKIYIKPGYCNQYIIVFLIIIWKQNTHTLQSLREEGLNVSRDALVPAGFVFLNVLKSLYLKLLILNLNLDTPATERPNCH